MRFFKNPTVRFIVFCVVLVTVAISPQFFVLWLAPEFQSLAISLSIGFSVAAIITCIIIYYKISILPIKNIINAVRKISKGEQVLKEKKLFDSNLENLASALNNTAYEFENMEQMRKNFISNASHELRSPLTSIQGFLQAILDGTIPKEETDKYLNIVFAETKRLSLLINSMLDLTRLESGKDPLILSRFEINAVVNQVIERFEPNLIKKEIKLSVDFAREFSYVFADKEKIVQVLINLIDNAIKYSHDRSKILVTTHIHGKKIYVSVKDKGFGISKNDQLLIWDRFYMTDIAHTPTNTKGTGLGLSIAKQIIDDHKETIGVESAVGVGSSFIFTLPIFNSSKHKEELQKQSKGVESDTVNEIKKQEFLVTKDALVVDDVAETGKGKKEPA